MNKQLAKTGSTLDKNMTNTDSLALTDLNVATNLIIPIYISPNYPPNPTDGCFFLQKNTTGPTYQLMYYIDGAWHH